jgi:hypothetical protein
VTIEAARSHCDARVVVAPSCPLAARSFVIATTSQLQKEDVMKYMLAFRGQAGRQLTGEEEARWPAWFDQIKDSIANFGSRVGEVREVGARAGRADALSGYIVINADSLDAAATLADGCPIHQQGGSVEVGELVDA